MPAVDLADVENATDIWVRHLTRVADLGVKAFEGIAVVLVAVGQEFESDDLRRA